jgi:MFS family permease
MFLLHGSSPLLLLDLMYACRQITHGTQILAGGFPMSIAIGTTSIKIPVITRPDVVYASVVAFFAWVFSVYDFIMFGLLLPVIGVSFGWSTGEGIAINTWVTIGSVLVALTVGPITDYFGRKNALTIVTAGAALSSGLTALAFHPLYIILVRAFSGFGYSEQAVNTTYLSELYGKKHRGFGFSVIQGGWPIGVILAATMSSILLPSIGWRGVFGVAALPAVIIVLLRLRLKETPRFAYMQQVRELMKAGRTDEHGIDAERSSAFTFKQLFGSDVRKHTIFITLAYSMQWVAAPMYVIFATTVLTQGKGLNFENSLLLLIGVNLVGFLGYLVFGYLGDLVSRRNLIIVGWTLAGIFYAAMILFGSGFLSVMVLFALSQFFEAGVYAPTFTYFAESYPTRMRGSGASFANAMGQIGGIVGSALFAILLGAGVAVGTAALYLGFVPMVLASLLMFGGRNVAPQTELEAIAI